MLVCGLNIRPNEGFSALWLVLFYRSEADIVGQLEID